MVNVKELYEILNENNINFFTGVPDSTLKNFCNYIMDKEGVGKNHIVAPNEGNAVALAAGHYLATGEVGVVYMQNSGIGNAINPMASLTDTEVYGIPMVYMIGWRGQPGTKDEPQHIKQGKITIELLDVLGIEYFIITRDTKASDIRKIFDDKFLNIISNGKSIAFVIEKDSLEKGTEYNYKNTNILTREDAVITIVNAQTEEDINVSTTGKVSRELFEYREKNRKSHAKDFLTVGSMGHASMIALSIAEQKEDRKVWCIDGDGAMIMHMGAIAMIGTRSPKNFCHILMNNGAHETVGGVPTVSYDINWSGIVLACGYKNIYRAKSKEELEEILKEVKEKEELCFIEIMVNLDSRENLIRPTTTAKENKEMFMKEIG